MRKIAFRVWLQNMMWEHGSFDLEIAIKDGGCELMQFTGLTDRNGKEIFEGDVISHKVHPNVRGEVYYEDGGFFFNHYKEFKTSSLRDWHMGSAMEVLGNIYSNPELLK